MRLFLRAATFVAVVSWPTVWNGSVAVIAPGVVREAPGVMVLSSSGVLANGLFDLPDRMRQTLLFVFGRRSWFQDSLSWLGCLGELSNCWS